MKWDGPLIIVAEATSETPTLVEVAEIAEDGTPLLDTKKTFNIKELKAYFERPKWMEIPEFEKPEKELEIPEFVDDIKDKTYRDPNEIIKPTEISDRFLFSIFPKRRANSFICGKKFFFAWESFCSNSTFSACNFMIFSCAYV